MTTLTTLIDCFDYFDYFDYFDHFDDFDDFDRLIDSFIHNNSSWLVPIPDSPPYIGAV